MRARTHICMHTCTLFQDGSFPYVDLKFGFAEDLSKGVLGGDRDVYYPKWFLGEWEARG